MATLKEQIAALSDALDKASQDLRDEQTIIQAEAIIAKAKNAPTQAKHLVKKESRRLQILSLFKQNFAHLKKALWRCARDISARGSSRWIEIQIGTRVYYCSAYRTGLSLCRWQVIGDDGVSLKSEDFIPPPDLDGVWRLQNALMPLLSDGSRHHIDLSMTFTVRAESAPKHQERQEKIVEIKKNAGIVVKRKPAPR